MEAHRREWKNEGKGKERNKKASKTEIDGGMVEGRKRRLDYTSLAAQSLFGRNRFFITESFIGFIPNCTFGEPS